jgi:hypothetical protein
VVAVLAVLLLLGGAILALTQLRGDPPTAQGNGSESSSDSGSGSSDEGGSDAEDTSGGGDSGSASEAEAKEELVRDYYAAAPGGTDEAWAMLGPELKAQGRDAYNGFWQDIESVDVQSAEASEGSDTVAVTLVYRRTDGSTSTERKQEGLVPDGEGGWLLNTDEPAS